MAAAHSGFAEALAPLVERGALPKGRALSLDGAPGRVLASLATDRRVLVRRVAAQCAPAVIEGPRWLMLLAGDKSAEVRCAAIDGLAELRQGGVCPRVVRRALADHDALVRTTAAEAVGRIGDTRALAALWRALNDRSELVRSYAAAALGRLAGKHHVARLTALAEREVSALARIGFYDALYMLGERKATVAWTVDLLAHDDYRVRCAAANLLSAWRLTTRARRRIKAVVEQRIAREQSGAVREALERCGRALAVIPSVPHVRERSRVRQ